MPDILYSINNINMGKASANPYGWAIMRAGTNAIGGITKELNRVTVPGRDGYYLAPSTRTEQLLVFNIRTPREHLDTLLAHLSTVGLDTNFPNFGRLNIVGNSTRAAYFYLASAIPSSDWPSDSIVTVTATLSIPFGGWRDMSTSDVSTSITTNPQSIITLGAGSSLPITDMDIFIGGNVGATFQVTDASGAWLRTTSAYTYSAGTGLYYQGSTGRAFRANDASPWTATADLGFAVDTSNGGFRLTPTTTITTPTPIPEGRSYKITVLSTLLSGVSFRVRYRAGYIMR